jgi:hypothetical protein
VHWQPQQKVALLTHETAQASALAANDQDQRATQIGLIVPLCPRRGVQTSDPQFSTLERVDGASEIRHLGDAEVFNCTSRSAYNNRSDADRAAPRDDHSMDTYRLSTA